MAKKKEIETNKKNRGGISVLSLHLAEQETLDKSKHMPLFTHSWSKSNCLILG